MGILKAVAGAIGGGLADSWLEVVEPDNMTATTVCTRGVQVSNKRSSNKKGNENIISNGSVIHVGVNQMMLLVDGGKIIDYSAEPGYYEVYLSSTPSMFNGELKDSIKETFSRIKFGTRNALQYFDNFYNAELFVRCHGSYSIKITDPLKFFSEAVPRNAEHVDINDINEQYFDEFLSALQAAIGQMSVEGQRISALPSKSLELGKHMSKVLDEDWTNLRGMEICSVGVASISYDEESKKLINMRNQGAMMSDATIREGYVQSAVAGGLQAAGSNTAGAGNAFMAMGMGMGAAGNFMGAASATNAAQMQMQQQQQAQQALQPNAAVQQMDDGAWTCKCGQMNSGKFCSNCGGPKPAPAGSWTCKCGQTNTGKFCPNCGSPAPQAGKWTCACGAVNEGAFCSNCGTKRS